MSPPKRHYGLVGLAVLLFAVAVAGFLRRKDPPQPPRPALTGVAAVAERFQCYRCHDAPGKLAPAAREQHCVRCHQAVHAGAFDADYEPERVAKWKRDLVHLRRVPSLAGVERRLRRDWFEAFLQRPHDLRPNLDAEMPRLAIGPEDARAITELFYGSASAASPAPLESATRAALGDARRGRVLFRGHDCMRCHAFTGAGTPSPASSPLDEVRLAPDLRHARARMTPDAVLAWLADPRAIKPDTLMPRFELSEAERRDLAAFLLGTELTPPPARAVPERLPLLERHVTHAEVEERVFKRICWHCHSDPIPVGGDGGPGNTGGFGFPGKGLDLGSYEAIQRGGRDASGAKLDVLAPDASGLPKLVNVMLRRHAEVAGDLQETRGMPLGLPPMPLEEIQLVETWIAQGAPRE